MSGQSPTIAANIGESMSAKVFSSVSSIFFIGIFPVDVACLGLSAEPLSVFTKSFVFSTGLLNSTWKRASRLAFACFSLQEKFHE